ncbi:MAG: SDR family oxidoreductase [Phycisphaerales bacterium]|nr:SDR family oxidoreductase [Phycisphaerales bacterium]
MQVLVSGHHGYIGAVLVPALLADGHDVVGMDSNLFAGSVFPTPAPAVDVPVIRGDIRDARPADFAGIDVVIHLAALSNDPLGDLDPALTREINFDASQRLAELAKAAGVRRFLFSSSCSTYGAAGDRPLDESASFNPLTAYAREKVRLEATLAELADDVFSPVFLRNATAYGLSPRLRLDIVLNNLVAWAVTTRSVRLLSDGTPWRPIVHVEDIASAFVAAVRAPREVVHGEAFNVGRSEHNYRILELAEIVADVVPDATLEIAADAGPDPRSYRVDFSKIERALPAWRPQWDARRSATRMAEAFRRFGLTAEDLDGPRFIRLRQLQTHLTQGRLRPDLRWATAPART